MSQWISVEDRLPENGQPVLCYAKSFDDEYYSIMECSYMERHPPNYNPFAVKIFMSNLSVHQELGRIQNPEIQEVYHYGNITHWMPLPELP